MKKCFIQIFLICIASMVLLPQSIRVTSPNGGEKWLKGSIQEIKWEASDISNNFKITLWRNDYLVGVVADNISSSIRSYPWEVGTHVRGNAIVGHGYKIKVKEKKKTNAGISEDSFSIIIPPSVMKSEMAPMASITQPTRGTVWYKGNTYLIQWTSQNIPRSSSVGIKLNYGNEVHHLITNNFPNQGEYKFTVPCDIPARNRYTLTIYEKNKPEKNASVSLNIYDNPDTCLPDLVVCVTCGKTPKLQEESTITAYVMNIGNKRSGPCKLIFDVQGVSHSNTFYPIPRLEPHGRQTYTVTQTHRWSTKGEKFIFLSIDSGNFVAESDESNNWVRTFYKVRLAGSAVGSPNGCRIDRGVGVKIIRGEKCACSYQY